MAAVDTYSFGAGVLWATQLTDYTGAAVSLATPLLLGTIQDVTVDISYDSKPLHGQNAFAVANARGKGKVSGKAKFARLDGLLFQSVVSGMPITSGIASMVYDTTGATIPSSPYTITPTVPGSGTFARVLSVRDGIGNTFTQVASGPTAGQYSLSGGVFTFAAADTGKTVFIDFAYTATSTTAKKVLVTNQPMGYAPTFRADFFNPRAGMSLTLFACMANKFAYATKIDDWAINEIDFDGFADSNANVYQFGTIA